MTFVIQEGMVGSVLVSICSIVDFEPGVVGISLHKMTQDVLIYSLWLCQPFQLRGLLQLWSTYQDRAPRADHLVKIKETLIKDDLC